MKAEIEEKSYFETRTPNKWTSDIQEEDVPTRLRMCKTPATAEPKHWNVLKIFPPPGENPSAGSIGLCPCCIEVDGKPDIENRYAVLNLKDPYKRPPDDSIYE